MRYGWPDLRHVLCLPCWPNPSADHNLPCTPSWLSTPVGGLTLALSRENSVKGGQAACASRERSVRDGSVRSVRSVRSSGRPPSASPLERSVSSGQRTYRGLQLADNRPTEPAHHMRRLEEAFGVGSADWMGDLPPARLADMVRLRLQFEGTGGSVGGQEGAGCGRRWLPVSTRLHSRNTCKLPNPACLPTRVPEPFNLPFLQLDSCEHSVAPGAALQDPFVLGASPGAANGSRRSSHPATCRPSDTIPEEEREELFDIQPQEVCCRDFELENVRRDAA